MFQCRTAALSCALLCSGLTARAQVCIPQYVSGQGVPGVSGTVHAVAVFDSDGPGPEGPLVIAGGEFVVAGDAVAASIAAWDGSRWIALGAGIEGVVHALHVFDQDANGPIRPLLVAGGRFSSAGDTPASNVAAWDGVMWRPLDQGIGTSSSTVRALTTMSSSKGRRLVAGGTFESAGTSAAVNIATWNGDTWASLGDGPGGAVHALIEFDPDGAGPTGPSLIAGGNLGAPPAGPGGIARWNGSDWVGLGSGVSGSNGIVNALTTIDIDGQGPLVPRLIAGGIFQTAGGQTASRVAQWDGNQWAPLAGQIEIPVQALATFDIDGPGPALPSLMAGGQGGPGGAMIQEWRGTGWSNLSTPISSTVRSLAVIESPGPGGTPARLFAAGLFGSSIPAATRHIAEWNGTHWSALGSGNSGGIYTLARLDLDESSPGREQVIAAGNFDSIEGTAANRIATHDGASWHPFGTGIDNAVYAVCTHDPDGPGASPTQVIAAGAMAGRVTRWDGSQWQPMGLALGGVAWAVASFDPDGSGPAPRELYAGGQFTATSNSAIKNIARWDGSTWQPVGLGLGGVVSTLTVFDTDGSGAAPAVLVAGGHFASIGPLGSIGSVPVNHVAAWNGVAWGSMGSGAQGPVHALTSFDPDGSGPQPSQLIAAGLFTPTGGPLSNRVARWDGATWIVLGDYAAIFPSTLATIDFDGSGPLSTALMADDGATQTRLARWDGLSWSRIEPTTNNHIFALSPIDPDGLGPAGDRLLVGGDFTTVGRSAWSYLVYVECMHDGCYADCDGSTGPIRLTANDLTCFINKFVAQDPYANCDGSTTTPTLTANDFACFLNAFVAGCP
jgi:trimeric autotransporter adhesin